MKLELVRLKFTEKTIIGDLLINGKFFCNTLEDRYINLSKEKKIPNETAIPAGKYKVIVIKSPRFKRELPRLLNVPYFDGILIHRGNTDKDTSGCILVGDKLDNNTIINSTKYELELTQLIKKAILKKEKVEIDIF